ncbi:MAG: phospho-sugar mutase, partial [Paludibacteraceae bacterium]|nr:phospho-sugar mutase [Paludibacteraceae bacterium]
KDQGMSLYEYLINIYNEFGFQRETTVNVVRPGKTGAEEIQAMMVNYRQNPPKEIAGEKVVKIKDFQLSEQQELVDGEWRKSEIKMALNAKSNVLQYFTEGGLKVSVRPSGTEPKIKFYFEIPAKMPTPDAAGYKAATAAAEARVPALKASLGI